MAISAVMLFHSNDDVRKIYDAVIDEMGVRDHAPPGAIHHMCAVVPGGLRVCDLWETREQFERFAQMQIGPITFKHGLTAPLVELTPVHEMILGNSTARQGIGFFAEWEGDTTMLLQRIVEANARMNAVSNPPDGLVMHWTVPSITGVRVIDHWRSRDDFERFKQTRLAATMEAIGMPPPRFTYFDIYNTIDPRVPAHA
jgi:hypothetical protein